MGRKESVFLTESPVEQSGFYKSKSKKRKRILQPYPFGASVEGATLRLRATMHA